MYRSLWLLSKLRVRGQWRKTKRALSSPKGIVMAVILLVFMGLTVGPQLLVHRLPQPAARPIADLFLNPALLLVLWLFTFAGSWLKSPIAFSMPEVDFLFAGPFPRRKLLVYKLVFNVIGVPGFALLAPLFMPFFWWPSAMLGVGLVGVFVQWSSILGALVIGWISARHRLLAVLLLVVVVMAVPLSFWQAEALAPDLTPRERLTAIESSWAAQMALAPFSVFTEVLASRNLRDLSIWSGAAAAIVAGMAVAVLALDGYFVEASLGASRRRYEMIERLRKSGGTSTFRPRIRPRGSLPRPPRLHGAGPIAWRQGLEALRGGGGWIVTLLLPAAIGVGVGLAVRAGEGDSTINAMALVGTTLGIGFLMMVSMPLALRSDLNYVDAIKALPIGPWAIVSGSIVSATLYVLVVQAIAVVAMAAASGHWMPGVPLALAAALPINLLSIAFDSVIVLLFPSLRHFMTGDPFAGVRVMLANLARVLFAAATLGVAGLFVLITRLLVTDSLLALVLVGDSVLIVEALATVWGAGLLFAGFDATEHGVERE